MIASSECHDEMTSRILDMTITICSAYFGGGFVDRA